MKQLFERLFWRIEAQQILNSRKCHNFWVKSTKDVLEGVQYFQTVGFQSPVFQWFCSKSNPLRIILKDCCEISRKSFLKSNRQPLLKNALIYIYIYIYIYISYHIYIIYIYNIYIKNERKQALREKHNI